MKNINADLDPDQDPESPTNADQDQEPGQILLSQKFEFLHDKFTYIRK
jgi:hypothetical protein